MLSPAAINEIRAELDRLRGTREKIDARIGVLEAVLQPFDWQQVALPLNGNGKSATITVIDPATVRVENVARSPFASTGLRAAILDVLETRGPARAPNIASILAAQGFENDSTTPLATRVYNDLWRMKEAGVVEGSRGVFALAKKA